LNRLTGFSLFFSSVRFVSAQLSSSLPFSLPGAASPPAHIVTPCHTFFPWSQDELIVSASSSSSASFRRLLSRAETEALNLHRHCQPTFSDRSTSTLHYYKNVISILVTLSTTQQHLYFISYLARAPCHRSSTRYHRSLSPSSHANRSST
jgi:hypothetical protein